MIFGIGNENRGDDGIGARIVGRIAELRPDLETRIIRADGLSLMEAWAEKDEVVLVDVIQSGAPVGTVHRFDASDRPVPFRSHASTHGLGVAEAIELGRSLGNLPRSVVVIGIESSRFELGSGLSIPVQEAAEEAMRRVLEEVDP